jgi:phosphoribosylformylglycinamidine cyclo-ligase
MLALFEQVTVKGVSHSPAAVFYENIPRSLKKGLSAKIEKSAVRTPEIFQAH